jgi:hypothetical protein
LDSSSYITTFVTTSPVPSNPSLEIIKQTLDSIRHHLPNTTIRILADAARYENTPDERNRYLEFLGDLRALLFKDYEPFSLHCMTDFSHQVRMMREMMMDAYLRTPLLMFMEHDTPLLVDPDRTIPWPTICRVIDRGDVDFIRFLPEPQIHPEHQYLMRGRIKPMGLPLMTTVQFSARPHVASRDWYRKMLGTFSASAQCFIEDGFYTHAVSSDWEKWKMTIYLPDGNAQRSLHLDGRAGAPKFDAKQVF